MQNKASFKRPFICFQQFFNSIVRNNFMKSALIKSFSVTQNMERGRKRERKRNREEREREKKRKREKERK